jgi:hypothetical protein
MNQEKKGGRETTCGPMRDASFMKKFQAIFDERDGDCAQMMARMRAMCCGGPEPSEDGEASVEQKTAQPESS